MKITTKINFLTTAWMLGILIIINIVVYLSVMQVTIGMEERVLSQRVLDTISELDMNDTLANREELLKENLTPHTLIRIILPNGRVEAQVTNDQNLMGVNGKYTKKPQMDTSHIGEQILISRQPILLNNKVVGNLEIAERILGLNARRDMLIWTLSISTILAALLSLLGGRWLSNAIMRPISNMIQTMEEIERSGVPKKIVVNVQTKDELHKMANTFNRMIERLQGNLEKQRQFISDASHELKTPLTVIKSYANLLRRRGVDNKEIAKEAIEAIHSEATRIQKMTDTFLNLAALENEHKLEKSPVELVSLCQRLINDLKHAYKREVTLQFNETPLIIMADELKIKQVMIIFLDNAMKYSIDKVEMILEKQEKFISIRIKDYGIGIPKEEIENIFERFYRVDKARSRATGGTGLGLSIALNIINLHKGEINIKSEEGEGTEVEVILPTESSDD